MYKETIRTAVTGVGHYEPLRHYAEVHLHMEPGEPGSGLVFATDCSEDVLDRNWQRLILTHLMEKEHLGVLAGMPITDMKITLTAGRSHLKHTEGGDFRQATYRAVRQGLMQAESVLLEPWYTSGWNCRQSRWAGPWRISRKCTAPLRHRRWKEKMQCSPAVRRPRRWWIIRRKYSLIPAAGEGSPCAFRGISHVTMKRKCWQISATTVTPMWIIRRGPSSVPMGQDILCRGMRCRRRCTSKRRTGQAERRRRQTEGRLPGRAV